MASGLNLAGKWGRCVGSCLKRKEALKVPTHSQALLALLAASELTPREGEKKPKTQRQREGGKAIAVLMGSAIQSASLEQRLKSKVRLWCVVQRPGKFGFCFASWQAYCASVSGERVAVELMSQNIWEIHQWNILGHSLCQRRVKLFFFFLLFVINYRCEYEGFAWIWNESWTLFDHLTHRLEDWFS